MTAFTLVSGRTSLALAETLQAAHTERPVDLLGAPADLARWVVHAGVLDAPPPVSRPALARARHLRGVILAAAAELIGTRAVDPVTAEGLNVIARAVRPVRVELVAPHGIVRTGTIEAAIASVARDAVLVFGGADAGRLRRCRNEGCRVVFVDDTRAGTRRWCDMSVCGNRAKVGAHRRRTGPGTADRRP